MDNSQGGVATSSRLKTGSSRAALNEQTSVRKSEILSALFGEVGDIVDGKYLYRFDLHQSIYIKLIEY